MKKTIILKIGGSVITHKHREGVFIRRGLVARIARELRGVLEKDKDLRLIVIHGAGAGGHQLAKKYHLENGTGEDVAKWRGAFLIRMASQKLNLTIAEIFIENGLRSVPVHTASIIVQKNGEIETCAYSVLDVALESNCVPLLYGEVVFDTTLGMSICSGDVSAVHLAKKYGAEKILFASDVDGIYDKDPHVHRDAKHIASVSLQDILSNKDIALAGSHHVDVTGGLRNKIVSLSKNGLPQSLKEVMVFNGLKEGAFVRALLGKSEGTIIEI